MLPIQIVLPHPSQPFKTTSPRSVDLLQHFTLFTHLLMKTAFLYASMHFYIFTFCNTLSWFIRLVSWNSIKGIKYFSSSTETKLGTGWFPFCCSCSVVIVIIFQVPRQNKLYNKKKGKIPFISLTFSWHLSDFPSQKKVKNVPTYPLHFLTFSALVDRHAAPLSCSDIFLLSFFTIVFAQRWLRTEKYERGQTFLFLSLVWLQLSTPTGNSRLLCEWMLQR